MDRTKNMSTIFDSMSDKELKEVISKMLEDIGSTSANLQAAAPEHIVKAGLVDPSGELVKPDNEVSLKEKTDEDFLSILDDLENLVVD